MQKGRLGEDIAAKYLQNKNYKIRLQNWRAQWCEIDLIAEKEYNLVFVEVKYRTNLNYGSGFESVNFYKKAAQYRAILQYLSSNNIKLAWRFDVITIVHQLGKPLVLRHFEQVPLGYSKSYF